MEPKKSKVYWPIVQGIPEEQEELLNYCLCSNGIYQKKKVLCGTVTQKIDGISALPKGEDSIEVLNRKIPIAFFWKVIEFFRAVKDQYGETLESYIIIAYDRVVDSYFLYVPKQEVTKGSVLYDPNEFHKDHPNAIGIIDFHAHYSFGANFSGTDDADDKKRERFSVVVGYVDRAIPDYKMRFSCSGKFFDMSLETVFCKENNENDDLALDLRSSVMRVTVKEYPKASAMEGYTPLVTFGNYGIGSAFKNKFKSGFSVQDLMGKDW